MRSVRASTNRMPFGDCSNAARNGSRVVSAFPPSFRIRAQIHGDTIAMTSAPATAASANSTWFTHLSVRCRESPKSRLGYRGCCAHFSATARTKVFYGQASDGRAPLHARLNYDVSRALLLRDNRLPWRARGPLEALKDKNHGDC